MEIMKDNVEKGLKVANHIKDQAKKLKGKVKNHNGFKAAFESELYIEGAVVRTIPETAPKIKKNIVHLF